MSRTCLLVVVLSLYFVAPCLAENHAEQVTTRFLYTACMDAAFQDDAYYTGTFCRAYIQGAMNAHQHLTSYFNYSRQYCFSGANVDKNIVGIFIKYAQENPIFLEKSAILTLYHALKKSFPCQQNQPTQ